MDRVVTGPGGSIRPTPSPDGKTLAFVRRVRTRTVLFVRDIQSGVERPVYDGLDRDMQETWAIHGVYPNFAWMPDGQAIVLWAGGKIRRVSIANGEAAEIPFRVQDTREVTEALRFPVNVAPDKFDVKMLRWVNVSPKGDAVVYQALGHIYIRSYPEGVPRRLTKQNTHFEQHPSFSPDGRSIIYTTWNDETLGSIPIVPVEGAEDGRPITSQPGHYSDPQFSPDGARVVFSRGAGQICWPVRGRKTRVSTQLPPPAENRKRISRSGERPHFGKGSDRVYFTVREAEKTELRSIGIDRSDPRTHLIVPDGTEIVVSPDSQWIAFAELFNVYIAPLAMTGQPVTINAKSTAIPLRRLSRDAGNYLHWSGDSKRVYWALGPELFTRSLPESFSFIEGAPEKLPEPMEKGVNIGFEQQADIPAGSLALVGARVITMRGDEVLPKATIVIERNRITAVGDPGKVNSARCKDHRRVRKRSFLA